MDGLLADLFDTLAYDFYNQDYKTLSAEQKGEIRHVWINKDIAKKYFNKWGGVEKFFAGLKTFGKKTDDVVKLVVEFTKQNDQAFESGYSICSHPASIDWQASRDGKIAWIKQHLNPQPNEMFFPEKKAIYAVGEGGVPNILIDDFPPYIQAWREKGGIAIEMRTDSVNDVYAYLAPKLEEAKVQINEFINKGALKECFKDFFSRNNA
jgi:hypothetical protein